MKILIIEDEAQAAWNLQQTILAVQPNAQILAVIDCIAGINEWFMQNDKPDLVFSDIQLGDGIVFDSFKNLAIPCPIIFCTAFDEYLLQAFKANGIDYLLKPIDETEVKRSFDKLAMLRQPSSLNGDESALRKTILEILSKRSAYKSNFLVPHRDKLIPIETSQIGYFKVNDNSTEICLLNGHTYIHNVTLDYLGSVLDPIQFHRVSRQYLLSYDAIYEIEHHEDRKLLIHLKKPCKEKIVVSKAKAAEFLRWMQKR